MPVRIAVWRHRGMRPNHRRAPCRPRQGDRVHPLILCFGSSVRRFSPAVTLSDGCTGTTTHNDVSLVTQQRICLVHRVQVDAKVHGQRAHGR